MQNEGWRRRASTPTHPFATTIGDQGKFWSHADLAEAKRKLITTLTTSKVPMSATERPKKYLYDMPDDSEAGMPMSARSPGSIAFSDISRSQSVDGLGAGLGRRSQSVNDIASGARSPTMMELIQHHGASRQEHPHNELASSWWQCCRENRDTTAPHKSHEMFSVKKLQHGVPIHEAPAARTSRSHTAESFAHGVGRPQVPSETLNKKLLYQRDPKGSAVQGEYPHCITNEAWAAPRGDETPPARYHSCELMALDKRRHATPIDGGKRWAKMRVNINAHPGEGQLPFSPGTAGSPREDTDERNLYKSNFTLRQHKRKHLAVVKPGGSSPQATPATPASLKATGGTGLASHRELQYAKRFNSISLSAPHQLHSDAGGCTPWPRPGEYLKDDASEYSSAAPPYPSAPPREIPQSVSQRAHGDKAITKFSVKASARSRADSLNSEKLLHSSQQEIALRKACCSTSLRHSPGRGEQLTSRSVNNLNADGSEAEGSEAFKSHRQLQHQKTVHTFTHDHLSRKRPEPRQVPVPPLPRTGQWTPAHI